MLQAYSEGKGAEKLAAQAAVAPWVGYNEENLMRKQILSISEVRNSYF
jgi:hypothetical protein